MRELLEKELQQDEELRRLLLDPMLKWNRKRASVIEALARKFNVSTQAIHKTISKLQEV